MRFTVPRGTFEWYNSPASDRCTCDAGDAFPATVVSPASPARRRSPVANESFPLLGRAPSWPLCFSDQIPGSSLRILPPQCAALALRAWGWSEGEPPHWPKGWSWGIRRLPGRRNTPINFWQILGRRRLPCRFSPPISPTQQWPKNHPVKT